jgi:hypothetical protein
VSPRDHVYKTAYAVHFAVRIGEVVGIEIGETDEHGRRSTRQHVPSAGYLATIHAEASEVARLAAEHSERA